jgi:hypothetical protein
MQVIIEKTKIFLRRSLDDFTVRAVENINPCHVYFSHKSGVGKRSVYQRREVIASCLLSLTGAGLGAATVLTVHTVFAAMRQPLEVGDDSSGNPPQDQQNRQRQDQKADAEPNHNLRQCCHKRHQEVGSNQLCVH